MKPLHVLFAALAATSIIAMAAETLSPLPQGWVLAGEAPTLYKGGVDHTQTSSGKGSKYIRSVDKDDSKWATVMQMISAENYRGKRLRLQAQVKTKDVSNSAGLWMRVDTPGSPSLLYNSLDKPIKGSTDWTMRTVVLDVAPNARAIGFGVIQKGTGQVWIDSLTLEPVSTSVPVDVMPPAPKLSSVPVL